VTRVSRHGSGGRDLARSAACAGDVLAKAAERDIAREAKKLAGGGD
jgi:hypothetical protein